MAYNRQTIEEPTLVDDAPPPPYSAITPVAVKNATNTATATVATTITAATTVTTTRLRAPQGYDYEDPSVQSYYSSWDTRHSQSESPSVLSSHHSAQQSPSSKDIDDVHQGGVVAAAANQTGNDGIPPSLPSRTRLSNNPQALLSSSSSPSLPPVEESVHKNQSTVNTPSRTSTVHGAQAALQEETHHVHHQGDIGTVQSQAGCEQGAQPVIYQPPPSVTCAWQQKQQQQQQQQKQQQWEQWQQHQKYYQNPPLSPPESSPASPTVYVPHSTMQQHHHQQHMPTTPMITASVPAQLPTHTPDSVAEHNPMIPMPQPTPTPIQSQPPALPPRPPVAGPSLVTHYKCRECGAMLASEKAVCQRVHTQLSRPPGQLPTPGSINVIPQQQQQHYQGLQQPQYAPYPHQPQYHIPQQQQYQQHYQYQHIHLPQTIGSPENNYGTDDVYLKRPLGVQPVVEGLKRLWLDATARTGLQTSQQQAPVQHMVILPPHPPMPLNAVNVTPHLPPQQQHQHQYPSYGYPHPQFHAHQYTTAGTA
ncbi:hypothetical protein BGZ51_008657, partial [Haplosporangium sp. Z 767]